jgi:hypothetical protein
MTQALPKAAGPVSSLVARKEPRHGLSWHPFCRRLAWAAWIPTPG